MNILVLKHCWSNSFVKLLGSKLSWIKTSTETWRPPKTNAISISLGCPASLLRMLKCSRANIVHSCFLRKKGRLLKLKHVSVLAVFNQIQDNAASVNHNRSSGASCGYKSINNFQRFATFFSWIPSISHWEHHVCYRTGWLVKTKNQRPLHWLLSM